MINIKRLYDRVKVNQPSMILNNISEKTKRKERPRITPATIDP